MERTTSGTTKKAVTISPTGVSASNLNLFLVDRERIPDEIVN